MDTHLVHLLHKNGKLTFCKRSPSTLTSVTTSIDTANCEQCLAQAMEAVLDPVPIHYHRRAGMTQQEGLACGAKNASGIRYSDQPEFVTCIECLRWV